MSTQKKDILPPHIKYPGMVLLFLAGTVIAQMTLLNAALSGTGLQVEENYYQRASEWDDHQEAIQRFNSFGWSAEAETTNHGKHIELQLTIKDSEKNPLPKLRGVVTIHHPSLAKPLAKGPLAQIKGKPGIYRVMVPKSKIGIWNIDLELERESLALRHKLSTEVR